MTSTDLDIMHGLAPVIDSLPGECVPYYLASGEGLRFETGGQLWTVIARGVDTGGLFDAAYIFGPRGASSPYHSLPDHQRSYFVVDGSVQVWLSHKTQILVAGDSVHVPPGEPIAYRMLSHRTRLLFYSASAGALDALVESDCGVEHHVYSANEQGDHPLLPTEAQQYELPQMDITNSWDITLPGAQNAYILREGGGEHRGWPDTVNSYLARGQNTGSRYFAVETLAAPQPYIIQHFHRQHTENFVCLSGRVWLWVNGKELLLTPGDFFHAPAGTIHSFAIGAHNTKMLGLLTSDIFEPFFDVTGVKTNDRVYTEGLIDPGVIFGGIEANPDLDLVVVGGPPERHRAPGI